LLTFFAAAKKVSAAPHRGDANKPIRIQEKAQSADNHQTNKNTKKSQNSKTNKPSKTKKRQHLNGKNKKSQIIRQIKKHTNTQGFPLLHPKANNAVNNHKHHPHPTKKARLQAKTQILRKKCQPGP
jgi:hypothetical protein